MISTTIFTINNQQLVGCLIDEERAEIETRPYTNYIFTTGVSLSPLGCFFKHSCNYNVYHIDLLGPKILYYTNKPVKKGEEVCIY